MWNRPYDLVVLIDCWQADSFEWFDPPMPFAKDFYKRMLKKLSTLEFNNVAIATYPNFNRKTDPFVLRNIRSKNNSNLIIKEALNFRQLYHQFPQLTNAEPFNVVLCGMSWQHCLHWRELGLTNWVIQRHQVHTHPDLCWREGDQHSIPMEELERDYILNWQLNDGDSDQMLHAYSTKLEYAKIFQNQHTR